MALHVQATCPGCKKSLRIPAQWIYQPMRCKHCGLVIQAKAKAKPTAPPGVSVAARTPVPPTRPGEVPFSGLAEKRPPAQAPRRRGGWRKGLFLAFCILLVAGLALAVYGPYLPRPEPAPAEGEPAHVEAPAGPDDSARVVPEQTPAPDSPTPVARPPETSRPPIRPVPTDAFPRRALVISVNHYLYANPINAGPPGRGGHNIAALLDRLTTGLRIPADQTAVLSDAAPVGPGRLPFKPVIEKTVSDFLAASRNQDRVLVMFIGHAVELDEEPYLAPLEGDLEAKETLIPLKWLYDRLAACQARQKVLVLDVCRLNPARGPERPGSGPMGPVLDAALKEPPPGVQVWSACVAGQYSYELDHLALDNGVFQEALSAALSQGMAGMAQRPEDPLPLAALVEQVNQRMKPILAKEQKVQTSRLTGQEPLMGAPYDPDQPRPPRLVIEPPPPPEGGAASSGLVQGILRELEVPPIRADRAGQALRFDLLPAFSAKALEPYKDDGEKTPFREAVLRARDFLNTQLRDKRLREVFPAPDNENRFKEEIKQYQMSEVATLIGELNEALEDLRAAGKERDQEGSKRWQAHYDYIHARLLLQLAYLNEYNALLGAMRKDLPPRDPKVHTGWQVASLSAPPTDSTARRLTNEARKILERLAKDHPGTPWEVLAKHQRATGLALEWQPTR